ncbi:DUF2020 domain-containing protein [Amycolatopsis rhizosphaerae]|uniref:DUF2020 domain-containing protein n=1 Tax=Amycolatopsis rhizosphaerae TaxID=2053003 RepID=A0A558DHW2_9PSEU|nr:DUF2020 domain-containing protein [Amycolatopsis rhizosphaerae]TVT60565.1 DUF2020 domain-containing protein [Amycolatopsis rhizosphaerae]
MRRVVLVLATFTLVTGLGAVGCSQHPAPVAKPSSSSAPPPATTTTSAAPALPPDPQPVAAAPCPYLATDFAAQANGQRVSVVKLSADRPHPACFFYDRAGKLQLTVRIYVGEPAVATALVDHVAPVDTSNPATDPPGWQGGYQQMDGGAVYAVAKQGTAVVVTTDQMQTVKARTVTKQTISALGL